MMNIDSVITSIRNAINEYMRKEKREPNKVALGTAQCQIIEEYLKEYNFLEMSIEKNTICGLVIERSPVLFRVEVYKEW